MSTPREQTITPGWCSYMDEMRGSERCHNCAFNRGLTRCRAEFVAKTDPDKLLQQRQAHKALKKTTFEIKTIN